jgi:hypothetical protein
MSFDLRNNQDEEFYFSTIGWAFYLNLATIYDWKMSGTLAPPEWDSNQGVWEGAYDWNAGQTVTESDAIAIANALEKYLTDANRHIKAKVLAKELSKATGTEVAINDDQMFIASFIRFAKNGEFTIW